MQQTTIQIEAHDRGYSIIQKFKTFLESEGYHVEVYQSDINGNSRVLITREATGKTFAAHKQKMIQDCGNDNGLVITHVSRGCPVFESLLKNKYNYKDQKKINQIKEDFREIEEKMQSLQEKLSDISLSSLNNIFS